MSKPKAKKGPKKPGAGDNDEEKERLKEETVRNTVRIEALERELFVRKEQTRQAVRAKSEVESRVGEFSDLIDSEKGDRSDIVADMTRQYKDMQEFLIAKNNELEQKIQQLQDEMVFLQMSFEKTSAEKDVIIAEKDKQIQQIQSKIDDMTEQFKDMLQSTLEKLTEKVRTGGEWSEELLPDKSKLEEYGIHL
ncbi:uncharacterized protein MONOS_1560 [Monocercomonoides exilis]|uniref:uncharacterized protein n=1 Tax=Monocercomonoides exilis TaxID=2049356 RepID=UPI00355A8A42|nr:hypothetical protein MONOS_1560 [Monocercomonoides exilis]|eukprot:MONOS_1560.1-p1 / transcript=MONOS_1560.1 / gene=MONOS_1560 / organism=Monocercomonoides_exilis_PA203 / gene_product=unspecified product / transcript_product=unspecified product / location=Mono_scaffold00028:34528-35309(-) / protein_length=193 / sequence_SO=supercontig / SO=protein_coding / is_pseudo=false